MNPRAMLWRYTFDCQPSDAAKSGEGLVKALEAAVLGDEFVLVD
jgi:hypothetical protein